MGDEHEIRDSALGQPVLRTPLDWIAAVAFIIGIPVSGLGALLSMSWLAPLEPQEAATAVHLAYVGASANVPVALALFGRGSRVSAAVFAAVAGVTAWQASAVTTSHSNLLWIFVISALVQLGALTLALCRPDASTA